VLRTRLRAWPAKFFRDCGGTDGSNPLPSSGESCERPVPSLRPGLRSASSSALTEMAGSGCSTLRPPGPPIRPGGFQRRFRFPDRDGALDGYCPAATIGLSSAVSDRHHPSPWAPNLLLGDLKRIPTRRAPDLTGCKAGLRDFATRFSLCDVPAARERRLSPGTAVSSIWW